MYYCEKTTQQWGRVLWITDNKIEIAVALDFGIRVVHMSCCGCENLFYVQPKDCSDGFTEGQWKLYGGHRIWLAPESMDSYYPDNDPVHYSVTDNGILFEQTIDPVLNIYKRLLLNIEEDGSVCVQQQIENASDTEIEGAAWGVNTLDGGGEAKICFGTCQGGGFNPTHVMAVWPGTNLGDKRLRFEQDTLYARHMPSTDYLKIGLYSKPGKAVFKNKGQQFELTFGAEDFPLYPDNGCNFELYMCNQFMELESLGKKTRILPGQCATHIEVWRLDKCD